MRDRLLLLLWALLLRHHSEIVHAVAFAFVRFCNYGDTDCITLFVVCGFVSCFLIFVVVAVAFRCLISDHGR